MLCTFSSARWQQASNLRPCGALKRFGKFEINTPINIIVIFVFKLLLVVVVVLALFIYYYYFFFLLLFIIIMIIIIINAPQ